MFMLLPRLAHYFRFCRLGADERYLLSVFLCIRAKGRVMCHTAEHELCRREPRHYQKNGR